MNSLARYLFLLIPLSILGFVAYNVWHLLPLSAAGCWAVVGAMLLVVLWMMFNMSNRIDRLPFWASVFSYQVGNTLFFAMLYLVVLFVPLDLLTITHVLPARWTSHSLVGTVAVTALLTLIFVAAYVQYRRKVRVGLQLATDKSIGQPRRLVLISDLHLGYHNRADEFHRWVDKINAEHPDVVLIGGDVIDRSLRAVNCQPIAEEFHRIEAPIYAVLGNHEYYKNLPEALRFYEKCGIHLLRDEVAVASGINVVGRDDLSNTHRRSIASLLSGADRSRYTVVLDHQPYHLEEAERNGVDFQFSGHTHRGQLWPMSWIIDRSYECAFGPWQRGNTHYYVSSGLGIWGAKLRIGSQSEYVVLDVVPSGSL